jgi:hypothetical protein
MSGCTALFVLDVLSVARGDGSGEQAVAAAATTAETRTDTSSRPTPGKPAFVELGKGMQPPYLRPLERRRAVDGPVGMGLVKNAQVFHKVCTSL